jgi:Integrase core domain
VWEILKAEGIYPAPHRSTSTWGDFLHGQAHALLAADFIETITLTGQRQYILAAIEHATRRIRILGTTAHPTAVWVTQAARNLVMDLDDADVKVSYLIRDRDAKFPDLFDRILNDTGIDIVLTGVRMPRMNSITERWVRACRRELLDRTLIWNEAHLRRGLRQFELHYNEHRPHQALRQAAPLPTCLVGAENLVRPSQGRFSADARARRNRRSISTGPSAVFAMVGARCEAQREQPRRRRRCRSCRGFAARPGAVQHAKATRPRRTQE